MNLRWLWMDHVPPGLELTPQQRVEVRKLAHRHRYTLGKMQETDMAFGKAIRPWIWIWIPMWAASVLLPPLFGFSAIVVAIIGLTLLALFHYHQTYRMHVYQALCDMGLEVCTRCGYSLRACSPNTVACPECGQSRAIDSTLRQDDESDTSVKC